MSTPARSGAAVTAAIVYALLVAIVWGAFNPLSGFSHETTFPYMSETQPLLRGFLFGDRLRIYMMAFYQLSYLLGEALGIGGSYVPFQVVYALLWWARGFLIFVILRRFLPGAPLVCYVAGALVLVHASDGSLQWVGQMNQFGFIFWMLLAFYFMTVAIETGDRTRAAALTLAGCFCECLSLWSYESQILLLLVFPVALLVHRRRDWRKLAVMSAVWYSLPALYLAATTWRYYVRATGRTYQVSVLRTGWDLGALAGDWLFNMAASLQFWTWARSEWKVPESQAALLAAAAAAVFLAGGAVMARLSHGRGAPAAFGVPGRIWWALLAAGFVLAALSFPVYLVLDSARGLWRTQLLSGVGSGLMLTALAGLLSQVVAWRRVEMGTFLVLGAVIVYFGGVSAVQKGALHRFVWERHRSAMVRILHVAPSVKPESMIVLVNVPKAEDPFGENMWLDVALRLVYPGISVSGSYFYTDGTPGPGNTFEVFGAWWKWEGPGFPPLLPIISLARTVVVDYDPSGPGRLEATLPPFVCRGFCSSQVYDPTSVISGPISPRTVRRYRLDSRF